MNTCRVPHLEMSPKCFTVTTIALVFASELTHCSLIVCDSEWMTIALYRAFLNIHWSGYSALWLLHGWCHVKPLPSRGTFCVHHTVMHQFTVSLYSKAQTQGVCVFSCNLSLHFWQNDRDSLLTNAVTRGWNGFRNESVQKDDHGEENSPPLLPGLEPETFRSQIRRSATELHPLLAVWWNIQPSGMNWLQTERCKRLMVEMGRSKEWPGNFLFLCSKLLLSSPIFVHFLVALTVWNTIQPLEVTYSCFADCLCGTVRFFPLCSSVSAIYLYVLCVLWKNRWTSDSGLMQANNMRSTSNTAVKLEQHCSMRLNSFPSSKYNPKMNNNGSKMWQ